MSVPKSRHPTTARLLLALLLGCAPSPEKADTPTDGDTADTGPTHDSADSGDSADSSDSADSAAAITDADHDGYADEATGGTDCDDADASVYPDAPERCDDGVVNDCEGDAATALAACGLVGARALSSAALALIGETADDGSGASIAPAGDADGDGRADLLIGASGDDSGGAAAGAAYLLLASAMATSDTPSSLSDAAWKGIGEAEEDWAGSALAGAGDIDGDGLDDLIVGAVGDDSGGDLAGAAYLLFSGLSGRLNLTEADRKFSGEGAQDLAGAAVAGAGDIDGDGRADLVIGAPEEDAGGSNAGAAYLMLGGGALGGAVTPLSLDSADLKVVGQTDDNRAGCAVAHAGDVDGDGRADLLVGAEREDHSGSWAGAAYLLLSGGALDAASATLDLADADLQLTGEAARDLAGHAVAGGADVDGDGLDDLLVGAWVEDSGSAQAGAAYLVLSGGALATASDRLELADADLKLGGVAEEDYAGISVSLVGDVDGDARADLLIGASGEDSGGADAGAAYLLYGGSALVASAARMALSEADATFVGEQPGDGAGVRVAGAGDVDGDGLADLAMGAANASSAGPYSGTTYLLFGAGY